MPGQFSGGLILPQIYNSKKYKAPLIGPNPIYHSVIDEQNGEIIHKLLNKNGRVGQDRNKITHSVESLVNFEESSTKN